MKNIKSIFFLILRLLLERSVHLRCIKIVLMVRFDASVIAQNAGTFTKPSQVAVSYEQIGQCYGILATCMHLYSE